MAALILALLLAADDPGPWIAKLGDADPEVRSAAERVLLRMGEPAAVALEKAVLDSPEARRRAQRLLLMLRPLRVHVQGPPFVFLGDEKLRIRLVLQNPGPRERILQYPIARNPKRRGWFAMPGQAEQAVLGDRWALTAEFSGKGTCTLGYVEPDDNHVTVSPGDRTEIPLEFTLKGQVAGELRLSFQYKKGEFSFRHDHTFPVRMAPVGRIRHALQSDDEEQRKQGLAWLKGWTDPELTPPTWERQRLVLQSVESKHADVRKAVVEWVHARKAAGFYKLHLKLVWAEDPDLAYAAVSALYRGRRELTTAPPELSELALKITAGKDRARRDMLHAALNWVPVVQRHVFLLRVLTVTEDPAARLRIAKWISVRLFDAVGNVSSERVKTDLALIQLPLDGNAWRASPALVQRYAAVFASGSKADRYQARSVLDYLSRDQQVAFLVRVLATTVDAPAHERAARVMRRAQVTLPLDEHGRADPALVRELSGIRDRLRDLDDDDAARQCAEWFGLPGRLHSLVAFAALELHPARDRAAFLLRMLELSQDPRAHRRIAGRLRKAGVRVRPRADGLVPKGEIPEPPAIGSMD